MDPKHHPYGPGQGNVSYPQISMTCQNDEPVCCRQRGDMFCLTMTDFSDGRPGLEPPCDHRQQPAPDLKPVRTPIKARRGSCRRTSGRGFQYHRGQYKGVADHKIEHIRPEIWHPSQRQSSWPGCPVRGLLHSCGQQQWHRADINPQPLRIAQMVKHGEQQAT